MNSSKFKILHIIPSLAKGGAERLIINICEELSLRENVEVKLIVLSKINEYKTIIDRVVPEIVNSKVTLSVFGNNIIDVDEFERIVNEFKPDIIHSHLFESEILSRIKIFEGVKYFSHVHSNIPQLVKFSINTLYNKKLLTNYFERRLILKQYKKCNNSFISISEDTDRYIRNNLPEEFNKRIHHINNAIDYNKFKGEVRVLDEEIRLVSVGSLVKKKNQIFLVDVVKALKDKGCEVILNILGDGPEKINIQERIQELGLEENVFLRGKVDDVKECLLKSNLYLHSAFSEPFGLVIIEAMATGLPCVCLDGKGNRNLIKEGKNGYLIEYPDSSLFSNKILEIISDKQKYSKMSEYCIEFTKGYDIKSYVDTLLKLYRDL